VVSIVAKNLDVSALRPALAGDWPAAMAAFDGDRQVNGLGVDTRGDSVAGLSDLLVEHGVDPIAWYGVRLFTDGWAPDRPATNPDHLLLRVELEASRRDPYHQLSRLFHLLGCRRQEQRSDPLVDPSVARWADGAYRLQVRRRRRGASPRWVFAGFPRYKEETMASTDATERTITTRFEPYPVDETQLTAVAFLARYSGRTLDAYRHDLRNLFQWAADHDLAVLEGTRAHLGLYRSAMEERGLAA
jgi:hypothetical protein